MATRKTQQQVTRVPAKELREYMKLPVDQALSKRGDEVRILPDGRVLWTSPGLRGGNVWPSREAYVEWCRKMEEEVAKSRAVFRGEAPGPAEVLLPPIDDFIRDVEAHAKSLGPRLRIPDEVLDFTPESLDAVDKALKRIPWAKREVPDLVTPLVAYLGEVIRRGTGGEWTKRPPKTGLMPVSVYDPNANEPIITTSRGGIFQPFGSVFLPIHEPSRRIPLRSSDGVPWPRAPQK
jgi:hypothetical protein